MKWTGCVKIQYAKIDNISIQFNFTTIAYAGSLKETQSQDRQRFILGNPLREETQQNFLNIDDQKYKDKTPNKCSFSLQISLSLSPMWITQMSVCVQLRRTHLLFILYLPLDFFPNQVSSNKLTRATLPRKTQKQYNTNFWRALLTWLTTDVLTHEYMMNKYNNNIPTKE